MADTVSVTGAVANVSVNGTQVYPAGPTPPIPPTPPTGGGMFKPTSAAALATWLQKNLDAGTFGVIDPTTPPLDVAAPIKLTINNHIEQIFGCNFNGLQLNWTGGLQTGPVDLMTITCKQPSRLFTFEKLNMYGGAYTGQQCRNGLMIKAPAGLSMRGAVFRDCGGSYFNNSAIYIAGDFFESTIDNPNCEANLGDGLTLADNDLDGAFSGIISDVSIRAGNLSRNRGYGLKLADQDTSVNIITTWFINNALGGIYAKSGIRSVDHINGENTGLSLIVMPGASYVCDVIGVEFSSDGATVAPGGKPSQYLINYGGDPAKLLQMLNRVTYYGSGTNNMAVMAPAGTPPS